ncbi:Slt family transglycosylase [Klebsiella pneumoniae]|uniref:Slt family transglycosylase n=1 Tax=Klebsiella pneumoniae TaxID=573 RepID=A0A447RNV0_KLEPN|nr:Slt family transglycosylase [Klebsiella pneumoniae]
MLDAMALTRKQKGNPNSWADVKLRLPLLSQKPYYSKLKYGYAAAMRPTPMWKTSANIR